MKNNSQKFLLLIVNMCLLIGSIGFAAGNRVEIRAELEQRVDEITGVRENAVTKRGAAMDLCDKIRSLEVPTTNDLTLLAKYMTLADPNQLKRGLNSPANVFPAVAMLVVLKEKGAEGALDAVRMNQINPVQTAINVAYVLTHTVGSEQGLLLIQKRLDGEEYTDKQMRVVKEVKAILSNKLSVKERQ